MPKKKSKAKTVILVLATALIAGGAVAGGFAIKKYVDENAIAMPWSEKQFENTYVGVRLYHDGETDPVRLGAAANFKAGINGERNDFDAYPVFSGMKQHKNKSSDFVVTIDEHYVKTVATANYTDYMMSPTKLDDTWIKVGAHDVGSFQANLTKDSKGKGTFHSQKDTYLSAGFTKVQAAEYAKNAGAYLTTYTESMDVNYLMTIEFATDNLQDVFSGYTNAPCLDEELAFDLELQDTGKTNIFRVEADALNDLLGDRKVADMFIPGFTSFNIIENSHYTSSSVATVTGVKKVNYTKKAASSSSSSASSEEAETVNCYEITLDKSVKFEDEIHAMEADYKIAEDDEDAEIDVDSLYAEIGIYAKNGLTDGLKGTSHELRSINGIELEKGRRPFAWRGIENWYGNVYEWLDGVQTKAVSSEDEDKAGSFLQVCDDKDLMGESKAADSKTPDYKTVFSVTSGNTSGWISGLAEGNDVNPFIIAGTQNNAPGSLNDYLYMPGFNTNSESATLRPVFRGSYWSSGSNGGAWFLRGLDDFDSALNSLGARLGF